MDISSIYIMCVYINNMWNIIVLSPWYWAGTAAIFRIVLWLKNAMCPFISLSNGGGCAFRPGELIWHMLQERLQCARLADPERWESF